jgi:hypothetical protein
VINREKVNESLTENFEPQPANFEGSSSVSLSMLCGIGANGGRVREMAVEWKPAGKCDFKGGKSLAGEGAETAKVPEYRYHRERNDGVCSGGFPAMRYRARGCGIWATTLWWKEFWSHYPEFAIAHSALFECSST